MSNDFSLAIATPTHRGLFSTSYVKGLWGLQRECLAQGIPVELLTLANNSMIDRARNILTSFFLHRTDFSHLLFIDDDMGFHVDELMRMFQWRQHDVIAAMASLKEINWRRIKEIVLAHPDIDPALLPQLTGEYRGMYTLDKAGQGMPDSFSEPVPVKEIGTGLMLISRACLQRLVNAGIPSGQAESDYPVHEFFRQKVIDGRLVGEDFYFCNLVQKHGGTVYGCAWPTVIHTGPYDFVSDMQRIAQFS